MLLSDVRNPLSKTMLIFVGVRKATSGSFPADTVLAWSSGESPPIMLFSNRAETCANRTS